jgi:hypothetical protein
MLPVSLGCPFLISPSVFSNVYCVPYVSSQSRETGNKGYTINVREYRRGNQKWTTQRNWQHRVHNKHFGLPLRYSLTFIVYPMLPDSLGCPFLISPSVFSNVYCVPYVASFSGLSIFDFPGYTINVREYRRGNQKWTTQSNWHHRVHNKR